MKIKIIKRADSNEAAPKIHVAANDHPGKIDVRTTTATIQYWIDDLRRKRERERISIKEFFGEERFT
jgi:hypothetical protein